MSDIQQWRRKIQPARSRTPATLYEIDDTEDNFSTEPKKRVKPKLSTYFSNTAKSFPHEELTSVEDLPDLPSWPPEQTYPDPKPEELMNGIMCRIMSNPYQALESRHHSSLMMIFEHYGQLLEEKALHQQQKDADATTIQALIRKLDEAEEEWNEEKLDYKDEVKRLEVLLAKESRRGIAEVTLARQDSKLRHRMSHGLDRKETIFEFLEKSNLHDDRYHSQRAVMKPTPILKGANDKDKQASQQQLAQKKSMTHLHAELPFGTPPRDTRNPLTNASRLAQHHGLETHGRRRAGTTSTIQSTSEDTFSMFSCESGAILDQTLRPFVKPTAACEDYETIERIATTLAFRRNVDPAHVMPQLLQLFNAQSQSNDRAASDPVNLSVQAPFPQRSSSMAAPIDIAAPKQHRTVMSKASGFFHKLVPQLSIDAHAGPQPLRRFSFEPGDDTGPANDPEGDATPIGKEHTLRRSVSADGLRRARTTTSARALSPVPPSPTPSALMEGRNGTPSRIPTPIFTSGSLAKPRQERDESASSLLTVLQYNGARSVSSSSNGSPECSRTNLARAAEEMLSTQSSVSLSSSNSTNRLHALRGIDLAAAAARTASNTADTSPKVHLSRRARSQFSQYGHSSRLTTAILQDENAQPAP